MARKLREGKRGTRFWGPVSGTTFYSQPSGTIIDSNGITIAAGDVLLCDTGLGFSLSGASVAWAGTTLQISHGFSVLQGISAVFSGPTAATGTSPVVCHIIQSAGGDTNSTVSVIAMTTFNSGASTKLHDGGATIFWTAFGK